MTGQVLLAAAPALLVQVEGCRPLLCCQSWGKLAAHLAGAWMQLAAAGCSAATQPPASWATLAPAGQVSRQPRPGLPSSASEGPGLVTHPLLNTPTGQAL